MARITWETVNGPSLADASRPLAQAGANINAAFDRLGKMVADRQAFDKGVRDQAQQGRVQSFLDRVQGAGTPEQVQALMSSGNLDSLKSAIGDYNPSDLANIRGAMEQRLAGTRKLATDAINYQNTQLDQQNAPVIDQIQGLAVQGTPEAKAQAEALIAANPMLRDTASLYGAINSGVQGQARFGWDNADAGRKAAKAGQDQNTFDYQVSQRELEREKIQAQIAASKASGAASQSAAELNRLQGREAVLQRFMKLESDAAAKLLDSTSGQVGSEAGSKTLFDSVSAAVPKEAVPLMTSLVAKAIASNPEFQSLPVAQVQQQVLRYVDSVGTGFWSGINAVIPGTDTLRDHNIVRGLTANLNTLLENTQGVVTTNQAKNAEFKKNLEKARMLSDEALKNAYPDLHSAIEAERQRRNRPGRGDGTAVPELNLPRFNSTTMGF